MHEHDRQVIVIGIVFSSEPAAMPDQRRCGAVPCDELIGDVGEIVTDDVRLGTDPQHVIPAAPDKGGFPTGGDRAQRVPGMAGDQAKLRGLGLQFSLDIRIGFGCGLMALHTIGAEAALEQLQRCRRAQLAGLDFEQIVGEREQTEAGAAQLAQGRGHVRMRWHRREFFGQFPLVGVLDFDAARIRQHLHDGGADIRERHINAGHGKGRGIHDEICEP